MRKLILILMILIAAVWAGARIAEDPGYALFVYSHWTVEMPLWLLLVATILSFIMFHYVLRILVGILHCGEWLSFRLSEKKKSLAYKALQLKADYFELLAQQNWSKLYELLDPLKKAKVFDKQQFSNIEANVYQQHLSQQLTFDAVREVWADIPKVFKKTSGMISAYAKQLSGFGENKVAERLVRDALNKAWCEQLVSTYANIHFDTEQQYQQAMKWYKHNPEAPGLYAALAGFAVNLQLWGQAKDFFEKSLQSKEDADVCYQYALFLESQGENDLAREMLKKGFVE